MAGFVNQTLPVIVTDPESKFFGQVGMVEEFSHRGYELIFEYENGDVDGDAFSIRQIENA